MLEMTVYKYKHRHVQALLATTDTRMDYSMAVEFAALRGLLPCNPDTSRWYCPVPIRPPPKSSNDDPVRKILTESPTFETVLTELDPSKSPLTATWGFLDILDKATEALTAEDTLVIALVGFRTYGGILLLSPDGQEIFNVDNLEDTLKRAICSVVLILPFGDPTYWSSPLWMLLVSADSEAAEGVFTRISQTLHVQVMTPIQETVDIFDGLGDLSGAGCSDAAIEPNHSVSTMISQSIRCIPASPRDETLIQPITPLSPQEETELGLLCRNYIDMKEDGHLGHPELLLVQMCPEFLHGALDDEDDRRWLYRTLGSRQQRNDRATRIAAALGWAVQTLGSPFQQFQYPIEYEELRKRAERSGCRVSSLVVEDEPGFEWTVAADWLARAWEVAGCPEVSEEEWDEACKQ